MPTSLGSLNSEEHKLGMHDPEWRQVVYDHRLWLKDKSIEVSFSLADAHTWRYRLQEFLMQKYSYPYDALWIVLYINSIENVDCDGGITSVLVPELSYVEELYTNYQQNTVML